MKHKSSMCLTLCGEIYMLNLDEALLFEADDHYRKYAICMATRSWCPSVSGR